MGFDVSMLGLENVSDELSTLSSFGLFCCPDLAKLDDGVRKGCSSFAEITTNFLAEGDLCIALWGFGELVALNVISLSPYLGTGMLSLSKSAFVWESMAS